jgi:predicted SAM-dependent methyltransferase
LRNTSVDYNIYYFQMVIIREKCSICNSSLNNIYKLQNVPIKLVCTSNPEFGFDELSISKCSQCHTIQLDKLIPLDILYSTSHNYTSVGKTWEGYFNLFCDVVQTNIVDKNILEIGDPSGKIATRLDTYSKWFIIEPNKNKDIYFNDKITFIEGFFDEKFSVDQKIDVIIHSHLFEHIYNPNDFLKKCYEILDVNGEMVFGVPNMEFIAEQELCPYLGVFFEHTIFLNNENISYLLLNNGFDVVKIIKYENHSTIYHCKKNSNISVPCTHFTLSKNYEDVFFSTIKKYKLFVDKCNNSTDESVYIFGASYNTQYILALGLDCNKVLGILDNCKEKQGNYLYGYNIKIHEPSVIRDVTCSIILKNGYYVDEILKQILFINPNTNILHM